MVNYENKTQVIFFIMKKNQTTPQPYCTNWIFVKKIEMAKEYKPIHKKRIVFTRQNPPGERNNKNKNYPKIIEKTKCLCLKALNTYYELQKITNKPLA